MATKSLFTEEELGQAFPENLKPRGSVGMSSKTPLKHWILKKTFGRIIGAGLTNPIWPKFSDYPLLVVDLCAGDGVCTEGVHTSSPFILHNYCWDAIYCANPKLVPFKVDLRLIEMRPATFEVLQKSVASYEKKVPCEMFCDDAKNVEFFARDDDQPCFINADPNNINQLPLPDDLNSRITPVTTFMVTLGCNVGGLKRLSADDRAVWFDYMAILNGRMPSWHDAILVDLNTSDQWAYLLRVPRKWSKREVEDIEKSAKRFGFQVSTASIKDDREKFNRIVKNLFLTKKEIGSCKKS